MNAPLPPAYVILSAPLPEGIKPWQRADALRLRSRLTDGVSTYVSEDALFWASNDRPVPTSVFREAFIDAPAAQAAVENAHTQAVLAEYRKSRENYVPSAEERYEMRAAFGMGAEVVDIVTGQKLVT